MEDKAQILETAKQEQLNGNYEAALNMIQSIFDPEDFDIAFEYGKTLFFLRRFDEAVSLFLQVNKKFPDNKNVMDILLKSYKESGRTKELLNFFNSRHENIEPSLILETAEIFFNEKKYSESAQFYGRYIDLKKEDVAVASKLVQIYNFLGEKDKVFKICEMYFQNDAVKNNKFFYNLFLNEYEIAAGKTVLESKPRIMLVMLTNKCNLKCPMCATVHQSNHWEISDKFKQYIFENLPNLELITWQGGEVFLYKDFEKLFIEASKNKNLKQIIITNALLVDAKWANLLSSANHLDLTVSIDSIEKEVYEKLRFGAKFEQLLFNLDNIKSARIKNNSNITLTMRTTISDENIYTLDKIVDFAINYKFDVLIWSPLSVDGLDGRDGRKYDFDGKSLKTLEDINVIRQKALKKARENNIKVLDWLPEIILKEKQSFQENDKQEKINAGPQTDKENEVCSGVSSLCGSFEKMPLCFRPWKQLATTVNGDLKPECMCLKEAGNIHKCEDYGSVWNNLQMQQYRSSLAAFKQDWCCDSCINGIVSPEHKKFTCW
ncbi:MAG: radical SAM protein [Endomicrobiaceae bacterium]|nr:radical SAM protein [Endomicrobiaceae bacterium]